MRFILNIILGHDDCFGLLIHHDAPFHFMVSVSDEYNWYKSLLNHVGSLSFSKFTTCAIEMPGITIYQNANLQPSSVNVSC